MKSIIKLLVVSLLILISISIFSQEINLVRSYRDVTYPRKNSRTGWESASFAEHILWV